MDSKKTENKIKKDVITKLKWSFLALVFILPFQNCGEFKAINLSSIGEDLSSVEPSVFQCASSDQRNPNASELKRLNKFELKNTIEDLLGRFLNANEIRTVMNQIQTNINNIPEDEGRSEEEMTHFDQKISSNHFDSYILLAEKISSLIVNNTTFRNKVIGTCSQNASDTNCRNNFIQKFGTLAFRKPLKAEDHSWYQNIYNGHSAGYENLIAAFLTSPHFIYHTEFGSEFAGQQNVVVLDDYEKASKLSYFYLQSMPDDELFEAAANGYLNNEVGLTDQINRLMNSTKARQRLTYFLSEQFFKLEKTSEFRTDIAAVNSRLNDLNVTETAAKRREHMINEVIDYMDYIIWEKKSGFKDLMTSELVFPRTSDIAEIYGTAVWNGSYAANSLVRAPSGQRSGVLTRAQQLFSGSGATRSIMRGVKVYNEYLCGQLPSPADNASPEGSVIENDFTEREIVQAITEIEGSSCASCHTGVINPLGFSFEIYDAFGKWRTDEDIYHPETSNNKGKILATKRVNSATQINLGNFITGNFSDAIDLTKNLSENKNALACFNLKLWDFAIKQPYKIGTNDCATTALYQRMRESDSIFETLKTIPLQPEFFKRKIQ